MFKIRAIGLTEKRDSLIYRMDPRAKLLLLFCVGTVAVCLDRPRNLLILSAFPILGHLLARFEMTKYKITLIVILIGLWSMALSQGIFYREWPRTVILTIIPGRFPILGGLTGGIYIYKQGLLYGLAQGLRFTTMISSGLLVAWTTEPRDLLLGMIRLRVPYGMAFMFISSVRFLPVLVSELITVVAVQRLRGTDPVRLGRHTIRNFIDILVPVLARSVKRAATLGASCESRAFNPDLDRTYLRELHYNQVDIWLSCMTCLITVTVVVTKLLFWLYSRDMLYISGMRWLYTMARGM